MVETLHFISGLPRSGSTLLAALLRQNPRFHADMMGPMANLLDGIVSQVSAGSEISAMVSTEQRGRILRGLFDSFYADYSEEVIFDTNRAWTAQLSTVMQLFPNAKVICCVRDVSWIMDSLEQRFRANSFENTKLFNSAGERATVYTRVETLARPSRLVGFAYQALREACWSEHASNLMIVDYDILVQRPKDVMQLIYKFIDEPYYDHDFDNVEYDKPSFDANLGLLGMHKVHRKVGKRSRRTILPPDLFERYSNMAFWRDMKDSSAFRIVSQSPRRNENKGKILSDIRTDIQN